MRGTGLRAQGSGHGARGTGQGAQSNSQLSPPFQGGVARTIDYLIVTKLIPWPGWLIFSFPHGEYHKIEEDDKMEKYP